MIDRLNDDARNIRKLMREAEGVADDAIVACAKLKQAMVSARSNPALHVGAGHAAVLRLTRAEQNFATAYGDLLRVHAELNSVAHITAGVDEDIPTEFGREPAGQAAAVPEMA